MVIAFPKAITSLRSLKLSKKWKEFDEDVHSVGGYTTWPSKCTQLIIDISEQAGEETKPLKVKLPFNKGKASDADKEIPSDYTKSKKRSARNQSTKPTQRKAKKKRTGKSDPNKDSVPGSSTLQDDEEENVLDYEEEEEELEEEMTKDKTKIRLIEEMKVWKDEPWFVDPRHTSAFGPRLCDTDGSTMTEVGLFLHFLPTKIHKGSYGSRNGKH